MMNNTLQSAGSRIWFVDIARIYGIALVYYGHFIESYMKAGSADAAIHYKFIYSFHMPLFFVLSGYIAKKYAANTTFGIYLKKHAASRLIPYVFLSAILILPTFLTTDNTAGLTLPTTEGYMKGVAATLLAGLPYFNIPTWFLICLFAVEIMHYFTSRFLTSYKRIILTAVGFYLVGSILAWNASFLNPMRIFAPHGKIFPYFMILEAFTAYSLYLVGVYLRRKNFLIHNDISLPQYFLWIFICFALIFLTFDLNKGMFTIPFFDAVIMVGSSHGNPILFPITAIIGSVMVMLLARITGENKILIFLGSNALIVFGLNGVYYHFVNDRLAAWLLTQHAGSPLVIFISGVVIASISIVLTVPFVFLLNHSIPQLIGKPKLHGPLIPRLIP